MKAMSKVIVAVVSVAIVAIAALVIYVYANLDSIVAQVIEQQGSRVTGTEVRVKKVSIRLREGEGSIAGITIANPEGFSKPNAFSLGEISTRIDIGSLTDSPIIIDHVSVDAPAVIFEVDKDGKINLNELKQHITAGRTPASSASESDAPSQVKILIRRLTLKDAALTTILAPLDDKTRQLRLPTIEFTNLGGEGGATAAQLSRQILDRLIERIRAEVKKQGVEQQLDALKRQGSQRLEREKQKLESKGDEAVEKQRQKAEDTLKDLLQR
jgi:uncharacterized protein involved in outer membrane biogenesis